MAKRKTAPRAKRKKLVFPETLLIRVEDDGYPSEFPYVVEPADEQDGTEVGVYTLTGTRIVKRTTELV